MLRGSFRTWDGIATKAHGYHILQRNCNHFADDLVKKLGGTGTPHWINRLANLAVWLHCLVPPGYLPDLIEERGRAAASQISGRGDPY